MSFLKISLDAGRELEQAAAHTLAIEGGVAQDTPETITSQDKALTDKLLSPPLPSQPRPSPLGPPKSVAETSLEKATAPAMEPSSHPNLAAETAQQQSTVGLTMESISEEPNDPQADSRPAAELASILTPAEELGSTRPDQGEGAPSASKDAVLTEVGGDSAKAENEVIAEKRRAKPRKAAIGLDERQPVRASKRSKPPAPWR